MALRDLDCASAPASGDHVPMIDAEGRKLIAQRNGARLDDALVYTPSQIKAEADTVNALVLRLATDVQASSKVPAQNRAAFTEFVAEWQNFYTNHLGFVDRLWFSTREKIFEYRKRAQEWRTALSRWVKFSTPQDRAAAPGVSASSLPWGWIALGVGGVVAVLLVTKIVRNAILGNAALAEAETEAIAIAEASRRKRHAKSTFSIT